MDKGHEKRAQVYAWSGRISAGNFGTALGHSGQGVIMHLSFHLLQSGEAISGDLRDTFAQRFRWRGSRSVFQVFGECSGLALRLNRVSCYHNL